MKIKKTYHQVKHLLSRLERYLRRWIFPKGLLSRSVLMILVPLLFLQAGVMIFFFDRHWDTVRLRLARNVAGELQVLTDLIDGGDLPPEQIASVVRAFNNHLLFDVRFQPDAVLSKTQPVRPSRRVRTLYRELESEGMTFALTETPKQEAEVAIQTQKGILYALISHKRFFSSTVYVFLIWMFGFSVLLFGIAFLFMKNQVRSIARLARAAELFGRGQSVVAFKPEGATEVRRAGMSFMQMRNRIQRYLTERTGMLSAVSHDLRTPLTRMKLQLSLLKPSEELQELQDDIHEMEHMLEAYLSFARGEGKEVPAVTDLNTLLAEITEKLSRTGQKIDFRSEGTVSCVCRPSDLSRAVTNLMTNAGRYAKNTRLSLSTYRQMARISVDDDGPGIPPAKRAEVFRAFYRLEESRNTHTGGIGLGLTITRDIVLSHGGNIRLSDSPMGGLRATILLPLAESEHAPES